MCWWTHNRSHTVSLQAWSFEDLGVHIPSSTALLHTRCGSKTEPCIRTPGCMRLCQPLGKHATATAEEAQGWAETPVTLFSGKGFLRELMAADAAKRGEEWGTSSGVLLLNICIFGNLLLSLPS